MVIKWMKRLKWMRISKYALIITLLLSLVFAGFTVYGARVGNFTIYLHADDVQLAIYMKEDMSDLGTRLTVPTLEEMDNTTFEDISTLYHRNKIMSGLGSKNDLDHQQYLAFSFVLKNFSERMVNYDMELTVVKAKDGFDGGDVTSVIRVLVIKEWDYHLGSTYFAFDSDDDREQFYRESNIYALPETSEENKNRLEEYTDYKTIDFISPYQLLKEQEYDFEPNAEVKYTIVMWLEGWDAECVNALYGGKIKMRLDITGR